MPPGEIWWLFDAHKPEDGPQSKAEMYDELLEMVREAERKAENGEG